MNDVPGVRLENQLNARHFLSAYIARPIGPVLHRGNFFSMKNPHGRYPRQLHSKNVGSVCSGNMELLRPSQVTIRATCWLPAGLPYFWWDTDACLAKAGSPGSRFFS